MIGVQGGADELETWLFERALPLWWDAGADHRHGGFHESLDREGSPVLAPRRARTQTRQTWVYATAGVMGWEGPWRAAVEHGLNYLFDRYVRPDGLIRTLVSPRGDPLDDIPRLYEQAFALLALAGAAHAGVAPVAMRDRALAMIAAIEREFGFGGHSFREADRLRPFQSNPLMHLFEASLAWAEIDAAPIWRELGDSLADLALTRLVDRTSGALREFFDANWDPAPGPDGRIVDAGHQFEWAWLLDRWGRRRAGPQVLPVVRRLFEIGSGPGVDRARGVAINTLDDSLAPLDRDARLWPQTERVKAAALMIRIGESAERNLNERELTDAIAGLCRYLAPNGAWLDRLAADGGFADGPSPATSLYHIVGAVAAVSTPAAARSS